MTLTRRGRRLAAAVRTLTRWGAGLAIVGFGAVVLPTLDHMIGSRTKYCVFAESTRDAVGRDHWTRNGFATDEDATENGIEMDLCPYWDPDERGIDNTDEYLLPTPEKD